MARGKGRGRKPFIPFKRKCIYCLVEKEPKDFNKEHVVPSLMGGFEQGMTIKSCCTDCNTYFGTHVDPVLAEDSYEAILRCQSGIKEPTAIDVLRWQRVNITLPLGGWWGGARVKLAWREDRMIIEPLAQIGFLRHSTTSYEYFTLQELAEIRDWDDLSPQNFKVMCQHEEDENKLKEFCQGQFGEISFKPTEEAPVGKDGQVDVEIMSRIDDLVKRAICKIAFNYLAKVWGPTHHQKLLDNRFDNIRHFVRAEQKLESNRFTVKVGNEHSLLKRPPNLGITAHLIALDHLPNGSLHCRFSPYDHFTYDVTLAENVEEVLEPVAHAFLYGDGKMECVPLSELADLIEAK